MVLISLIKIKNMSVELNQPIFNSEKALSFSKKNVEYI